MARLTLLICCISIFEIMLAGNPVNIVIDRTIQQLLIDQCKCNKLIEVLYYNDNSTKVNISERALNDWKGIETFNEKFLTISFELSARKNKFNSLTDLLAITNRTLEVIDLSYNNIKRISQDTLEQLSINFPALKELNLIRNPLGVTSKKLLRNQNYSYKIKYSRQ